MNPTPDDYYRERDKRGSQKEIAKRLGVAVLTIRRRECTGAAITRESWLALLSLPVRTDGKQRTV